MKKALLTAAVFCLALLLAAGSAFSEAALGEFVTDSLSQAEWHGFVEGRLGARTGRDPCEEDLSLAEARARGELSTYNSLLEFTWKGDFNVDGVLGDARYETRELWLFSRPLDFLDLKAGRQVLTWGTGDLVFLNDLFPKDWQSFFTGRDKEYLKAPSDALKISLFSQAVNVDAVYTPQFNPDRRVSGERLSYWSQKLGRLSGREAVECPAQPGDWFEDDEIALRLYKNVNNYELAAYAYNGFWKTPAGGNALGVLIYPRLNAYGASARGAIGPGIANLEFVYYESPQDESGANPLINNDEFRCLIGYTMDLARNLNASLQYYQEWLMDYEAYLDGTAPGRVRERDRHVITLQLTQLLMNQNLTATLASYYSPSDEDVYLRPQLLYKCSDRLTMETGANLFAGRKTHTFFSQFRNNANIYACVRFGF